MDISKRKIQPPFKTIKRINIIKAELERLKNNIPVYLINVGEQEILRINFLFSAGTWYESNPYSATATNSMLIEGTKKMSSSEIAEKLDFFGSYIYPGINSDTASLKLFTLNKHLPEVLVIIEDLLKNPQFPDKEFNIYRKKSKQQYIIEKEKTGTLARIKFLEVLFGKNHPYGRPVELTDFDNITTEQLFNFHKRFYNAGTCKIVVSGKINQDTIKIISDHFGKNDWISQPETKFEDMIINTSEKQKHFVKKENAVQASIMIGKILFNKQHPDFIKMQIVNTIFGGYFGSRLMKNIREDKGYTYGIYSQLISLINSGYLCIVSDVGSGVCKKAINEIYKEIDILKSKPVPEEELKLVKNYILGNVLHMFDGPFALAESFESIIKYGLSYDYFENFIQTTKTISSEEINKLANKYLIADEMIETTAGKANG